MLINDRWLRVDQEQILNQLCKLKIKDWKSVYLDPHGHYLFSGDNQYAYPYSLPLQMVEKMARKLNSMWHDEYNRQAIDYFDDTGEALNQAALYWLEVGDTSLPLPEILPISDLEVGREYIAIIGLFHLPGFINMGGHHLFIELLDSDGKRIYNHTPTLHLYYGWEGMTPEEEKNVAPIRIDKPEYEPGANLGLTWDQVIYGFHINNMATDRFRGVHIRYPDENEWNCQGHHSHYIVLQKRVYQEQENIEPPEEPELPETEKKLVMLIDKEWLDQQSVVAGQIEIRK